MYLRHSIGKYGEEVAERYLKQKNYKIIDKNFSCRQGKIDIIAEDKEFLIFVEVKIRTNLMYGRSVDAVILKKRMYMYKAAKYYLYIHRWEERFTRFDVIEVYLEKGIAKVKHIRQIM